MTHVTETIIDLLPRNTIVATRNGHTITTAHGTWRVDPAFDTFPLYRLIQERPTSGTVLCMPAICRQDFISTAARIISAAAEAMWGYTNGHTAAAFLADNPSTPDVHLSQWAQDNVNLGIWQTDTDGAITADGFRLPFPTVVKD